MRKNRIFKTATLTVYLLILPAIAISASKRDDFEAGKNLEVFFNVYKNMNLMYVDSVDNAKIIEKAAKAMLTGLDPYTEFYNESEMEDFKFATTGKYGGVGSLIRKRDSTNYGIIEMTYKGFPMDNAGVISGDTIIAIDGVDMKNAAVSELSEKMKGTPNSFVKMKIKSLLTGETKEHNIQRKVIKISPVTYSGFISDGIGYISFTNFSQDGAQEVKNALLKLKATGELKGLVLDLRDNGGGIIDEAVDIVGLFVPKGTKVVETKARMNELNSIMYTKHAPVDTELPLAVLINRQSASASEIVAGTLQDLDRAVVIGKRSFGKGLVQATRDVGYGNFIKITTAKYYTPSGRNIQALDYSHRNEDGSVGTVADSLISEFTTVNGRKVYNSGGIMPDIIVEPEFMSIFSASIYARGYFDDFSIDYFKRNRTAPPIDFKLPESEWQRFHDFIFDKEIEFSSRSENNLNKLKESANSEKIYDDIEEELKRIEEVLKHKNREKSLNDNKQEITEILENDIISRYYYTEGQAEHMARNDKTVQKAVEVLNNEAEYENILKNVSTRKKESDEQK